MTVENVILKKTVDYLRQLDLETDQINAYLFLLRQGPQTVLSISRGLKTGRTKMYPLLEELANKQLLAINQRHYGTSYEAQTPEVIEFLVSQREQVYQNLRANLPSTLHYLKKLQFESTSTSKIVEYSGIDGFKQMNWNLMKAEKEFRVYKLPDLDKKLGKHFTCKTRDVFNEKKLSSYSLANRKNKLNNPAEQGQITFLRYIDPKFFTIEFETYIYNNVVSLLSYDNKVISGIEIHNGQLARQQRQLFDILWKQASNRE